MIWKIILMIGISLCRIENASTEEKAPYPDLSCHPGYLQYPPGYTGINETYIYEKNEDCEYFSKHADTAGGNFFAQCPKVCSLVLVGVLYHLNGELHEMSYIKDNLEWFIINNEAVTKRIAERIHSECGDKAQAVVGKSCTEKGWDEVVSCLEKCLSCDE